MMEISIFQYSMHSNKPKIGITLSGTIQAPEYCWPSRHGFDYLKRSYHKAVVVSGGVPILLANTIDKSLIKEYVKYIDGLLISGGEDMDPKYFRQKPHKSISPSPPERDIFELNMIKYAMKRKIPIFGICRGLQVLNIALGGSLYQDLSCMPQKTLRHADPKETDKLFHKVKVEKGTLLHKIIGKQTIEVNSSHHQTISEIGGRLRVAAFSSDGVVEGLEFPGYGFLIAVQWHPEMILKRNHSKKLFEAFILAAKSIK